MPDMFNPKTFAFPELTWRHINQNNGSHFHYYMPDGYLTLSLNLQDQKNKVFYSNRITNTREL